jgi:hypothetical protein
VSLVLKGQRKLFKIVPDDFVTADDELLGANPEKNGIWEPSHSNATNAGQHRRESLGYFASLQQRAFDFRNKLKPESGALTFIPTGCFVEFKTRSLSEGRA